jgi:hypothetical protein
VIGNDLSLAAWKRVALLLPADPEARELLESYSREWGQAVERLEAEGTDSATRLEWELWRSLCEALEETGAVTAADLKTSAHVDSGTPGNDLLHALNTWGDARRMQARASGTG